MILGVTRAGWLGISIVFVILSCRLYWLSRVSRTSAKLQGICRSVIRAELPQARACLPAIVIFIFNRKDFLQRTVERFAMNEK